eukprot:m.3772 g.3772  ORF g.3772 m.3772 type:complete len:347 (-) comp3769_c0_seq1:43-1083(-)
MEAVLPLVGVATTGSHATLVRLARECGPLSSASIVLIQEALKLLFCILVLALGVVHRTRLMPTSDWILYFVPALCYTINNNIAVYLQTQMDPATFHVLCNFKILTTALLYRVMLNRHLSSRRWFALFLLGCGSALAAYSAIEHDTVHRNSERSASESHHREKKNADTEHFSHAATQLHVTPTGLLVLVLYCVISGFAGVYTEKLMRKQMQTSIFEQGLYMYSVGVILNGLLLAHAGESIHAPLCTATAILVASQAANGFILAFVMKHAGNILRLFVISGAMLFASLLSWLVFDLTLTSHFLVAVCLIIAAFYLYHHDPHPAHPAPPKSTTASPSGSRLTLPVTSRR